MAMMTVTDIRTGEVSYVDDGEPEQSVEPQPDPVPAVISRFQARAALLGAGLLADVELALSVADPMVQLAWAEAVEWRRDSPTIAGIAASLGLTAEQVDDLFRTAAAIIV